MYMYDIFTKFTFLSSSGLVFLFAMFWTTSFGLFQGHLQVKARVVDCAEPCPLCGTDPSGSNQYKPVDLKLALD